MHRLSWLDWRGQIDLNGWWSTSGIVLAGTVAAFPDISLETALIVLTLMMIADPLLGGFWSGLHIFSETTTPVSDDMRTRLDAALARRPLIPTKLRLLWPPILAVSVAYLIAPAAALIVGVMVLLPLLALWTPLPTLATPRAIMTVGLPWLLAYTAFDGDLTAWPAWGVLLLAVIGARDLFVPQKLLGIAALPLLSVLMLLARAPVGATIVWVLWTVVILFRVQNAPGEGWYLRHAQVWFVLAIAAGSWAIHL